MTARRANTIELPAGIRAKDGELWAEGCLRSLSGFVDDIMVLDDGSTDRDAWPLMMSGTEREWMPPRVGWSGWVRFDCVGICV